MKHVVITGPQACGKTRNKAALAKHFGCQNIVDGADFRQIRKSVVSAQIKTLYLTYESMPRGFDRSLCDVHQFHDAMQSAGLTVS